MPRSVFVLLVSACCVMPGSVQSADDRTAPPSVDVMSIVTLLELVIDADEQTARECLKKLTQAVQSGQLSPTRLDALREQVADRLARILGDEDHPLRRDVALLTTAWKDPDGVRIANDLFRSSATPVENRLAALEALIAAGDSAVLHDVERILTEPESSTAEFRGSILASLGRLSGTDVPRLVLAQFNRFEPEIQPRAIEVLTQRPEWTVALLKAIKAKQVEKDALNLNQLKRVALFKNEELQKLVAETYGAIRQDRRSDRQHVINFHRDFLRGTPGDPERGVAAFKKVCGQCHKIYGEGAEVGPDITRNGRNNWNQLLQNVFDPSAVIGPGYQARTLVSADGRVLTGLPVEESDQRIVLKIQGGKVETIPRDQIDAYAVSEMSMMPEDLEKQLKPQEIADLFSFLALDKPPSDPSGKYLPGAPRHDN